MREEIKVPNLGESISEASIGALLKPEGAEVAEGEELIELETDKVNQVLYAPISGKLSWKVKEGDQVTIGQVIGSIEKGEKAPSKPSAKQEEKKQKEFQKPPSTGPSQRLMGEDLIRELKQESSQPVESEKAPPEKKEVGRRKMTKIRQTIAKRLVEALHSTAMLTTFNEVNMSAVLAIRAKYQESFIEKYQVKLGLMSFFVKSVVEGLKAFPDLNAFIEGDEIVTRSSFDIGIAVSTEKGLIVPVIRNCDEKSFAQIEQEIVHYAQKARASKIAIADLEGGGFTITNGGIYGSMLSTPILNPPQSGILGMHKITKRPIVEGDAIVIAPMMYLALSYDHRLIDGKEAVSFLVLIKEILEDPTRLVIHP